MIDSGRKGEPNRRDGVGCLLLAAAAGVLVALFASYQPIAAIAAVAAS